jgi:ferredoxin-NADP reductase
MLKLKSVNFEQEQFQIHQLDQADSGQLEWSIGRNPTCDIVLANPEVSRLHGQIICAEDVYYFVDVGSTSGSTINGESVRVNEKYSLNAGDLIQIGETFLRVEELIPPSLTPVARAFQLAKHGRGITTPSAPLLSPGAAWEGDLVCRCYRIVNETPDVKTFCLIADSPILFNFKPGQFVNLEVEINGKRVIRSYSISSSPSRPYHLALTIKRVPAPPDNPTIPAGLVSNWLQDHLKVGDRIQLIGGPLGHFTCLPDLPPKVLFISAGSGITPMMSMSRWIQDTLANCDVVFLHSARTPEDIVFRTELEAMAAQMPNFHLAVTITRQALGHPWMGLTGRISEGMMRSVAPDLLERAVFVCGPEEFTRGIKSMLEGINFPMQNYKEESFGGRKATSTKSKPAVEQPPTMIRNGRMQHPEMAIPPATAGGAGAAAGLSTPDSPPVVSFAKSKQEVLADGSSSILELAEQEGIEIRNACRVGACGACKVLTREGKVKYQTPPAGLSASDQQAGYALACVAYPVNRLVVEA